MKLDTCMLHRGLVYYQDYQNKETYGWPPSFIRQSQIWKNAKTYDFIESFKEFGLELILAVVLINTFVNIGGHLYSLTVDPHFLTI